MNFKKWISIELENVTEGALETLRKRFTPQRPKPVLPEPTTPHEDEGRSLFGSWLRNRVAEDIGANQPSEVKAPTDPKEIARREATAKLTSNMMKKNSMLKPGGTDQQSVANLTGADPMLAKADTETQQQVAAYFLKK